MARPRLIIHVGHPKTGTSALQCAFARSIPTMAAQGLHYPPPPDAEAVRAGRTSSGNVHAPRIEERYQTEARRLAESERILFSSEAAFRVLPAAPEPLEALIAAGVDIEIILFVRNPLGLARSVYAQMVQRHGLQGDFDAFLERFRFLDRVELFLDLCTRLGLPVWAWNYSETPDALLEVAEAFLGLHEGTLQPPPVARVNRSLTRSEIRAVQAVTAREGAEAGAAVGNALCDRLPDLPPDPPYAMAAAYGAFARRIAPQVARINARLPEEAHLRVEPYEEAFGAALTPSPLPLSLAQEVIIEQSLHAWRARPGPGLKVGAIRALNARAPGLARRLRALRDRVRH